MQESLSIGRDDVENRTVIGLMSGTSLDGIDAAVLRTDGDTVVETGPSASFPYSRAVKTFVRRAIKAALEGRNAAQDIADATRAVTEAHVDAVRKLMADNGLEAAEVDLVGFHGQTIYHRSPRAGDGPGQTWQIGDAASLARGTGITVVADFRSADIAAGGEGAPFAPIYHAALARDLASREGIAGPIAALNLGGVANVTFVPIDGGLDGLVAFDCGPGNGLLDEWMDAKTGAAMDRDGKAARAGTVHEDIVRLMLKAPYIRRPAPKSLDRYDFKIGPVAGLSMMDGAATLSAFTAACVAASVDHLPQPPEVWVACGGGRRNPALMDELSARLPGRVMRAEDAGWRGDDIEAECFAYLAVRSVRKLPLSFPKTTGVPHAMCGGRTFLANA
ncbi:MAG: anhydro-N-acetylmuramic acid kinase [Alphaproteobacteria bacterium]|nr:anhydro-N-acetylmuramic acid kinase [Alphaproteobacteria bacterium]